MNKPRITWLWLCRLAGGAPDRQYRQLLAD